MNDPNRLDLDMLAAINRYHQAEIRRAAQIERTLRDVRPNRTEAQFTWAWKAAYALFAAVPTLLVITLATTAVGGGGGGSAYHFM